MTIPQINSINKLVESLRVEKYPNTTIVYNANLHFARLSSSITALNFKALGPDDETSKLFFYNQIKNFIQYQFQSVCAFREDSIPENNSLNDKQNFSIHKLRIEYDKNGKLNISCDKYQKPLDKIWQIKILKPDEFCIDSQDPLWRHKYLPRLSFSLDNCDEVIWVNEKGELCEGSFTNIFYQKENQFFTPSLKTNILAGVMRVLVIRKTSASEVLEPASELYQADKIFLSNALIGLQPAKIQGLA